MSNKISKKTSVADCPVSRADEDCLNMSAFADALSKFIEQSQTPITIALQGEWGCGKTSMMNTIRSYLTDDERTSLFIPIWVNTWNHSLIQDESESVVALLQDIIHQIREVSPNSVKEVADQILKGTLFLSKAALSVTANVLGLKYLRVGGFGSSAARDLLPQEANISIPKLREEIASLIDALLKAESESGRPAKMLFFIDDLDRMKPEVAVQILEVMKNLFDIENCVFVLSLDWNVVVKGLKPKFGEMTDGNAHEFHDFFDKVIQLPFSMPTSAYRIDALLKRCLEEINYLTPDQTKDPDFMQALSDFAVLSVGTNPRTVKRLVNYLSLIKILVGETESRKDDKLILEHPDIIFALVCLQIKYPELYQFLERHPNFPKWDDGLACRYKLPAITDEEMNYLVTTQTFDDQWEQVLYRICKQHPNLMPMCHSISQLLNLLWNRLNSVCSNASIGRRLRNLLLISSITSIKGRYDAVGIGGNANVQAALHCMRRNILELRSDRGGLLNTALEYVDFAARQKSEFKTSGEETEEYMRVGALAKQSTDNEPSKRVALEMLIHYDESSLEHKYVIEGRALGYDWDNKCQLILDLGVNRVRDLLMGMSDRFAGYFKVYPVAEKWGIESIYDENRGLIYRIEIPCGQKVPINDVKEAIQGAFNAMAKDLYELVPYLP